MRAGALVLGLVSVLGVPGGVMARNAWGSHHWARTASPFVLKLGDNVSSPWDPYLATAASDWGASSMLDMKVVSGRNQPSSCAGTPGRVEVCSAAYGDTGWLGVASISIVDGTHIGQATVRINDTYFSSAQYDRPAWRSLVMCQEVGHALGLSHQDEDWGNTNLGTCMDLTDRPRSNQHPNQHDHEELATIYGHLDGSTTAGRVPAAAAPRVPAAGGRDVWTSPDGSVSLFVRDLGGGARELTRVIWAVDPAAH